MGHTSEPWIGETTDGSRQIVRVRDRDGDMRYVTVDEILSTCGYFDSERNARANLTACRMEALRTAAARVEKNGEAAP